MAPEPSARVRGRQEYLERLGDDACLVEAAFEVVADAKAHGPPSLGDRRYRILRPHAQGGLGVVYRGPGRSTPSRGRLQGDPAPVRHSGRECARFLREAEITGGLEHPGIVPVYSLGKHPDGRPYYAMRLGPGY